MSNDIRKNRLEEDLKDIELLCEKVKVIDFTLVGGHKPPDTYILEMSIRSITKMEEQSEPNYTNNFKFEIKFPEKYPEDPPTFHTYVDSPIPFNPFFNKEGYWIDYKDYDSTEGIVSYLLRITRALKFELFQINEQTVVNDEAYSWYKIKKKEEPEFFPTDKTPLPLTSYASKEKLQEAEKTSEEPELRFTKKKQENANDRFRIDHIRPQENKFKIERQSNLEEDLFQSITNKKRFEIDTGKHFKISSRTPKKYDKSLDRIIKEVDVQFETQEVSEKIVAVDIKTKRAYIKKPSLIKRLFGLNLKYFHVKNINDKRNIIFCEGPEFTITDFQNNRSVTLFTEYKLSCEPGLETRLTESLASGDHPKSHLDDLIRKWLAQFITNRESAFINQYYIGQKNDLCAFIKEKAISETGLNLDMDIFLENEQNLDKISIQSDYFSIHDKDGKKELYIKFRTELEIDTNNKINAVLSYHRIQQLENLIINDIKNFFANHLTLRQIYNEINSDTLKSRITEHINRSIINEGRRIDFVALTIKDVDKETNEFFEIEKIISYPILEYPEPVDIKNRVQMVLEDIGKYRIAGSPNLEKWLGDQLERYIRDFLFDAKYIDILLRFRRIEDNIKNELRKEAKEIGYEIRHLLTIPDLEPLKLKENFSIETEGKFETKITNVNVNLRFILKARIPDLNNIESELNRRVDIKEEIKELILNEARQFLHKTEPETFYMKFYTSTHNEQSLEQQLKRKINNSLIEKFSLQIYSLIIKVDDDELIERFRRLHGGLCKFEFQVSSLQGGVELPFLGIFRIDAVHASDNDNNSEHGWYLFQSRKSEINDIKLCLERHLELELQNFSFEDLSVADRRHHALLKKIVNQIGREYIAANFGLDITITDFNRKRTSIEREETDEKIELLRDMRKEQNAATLNAYKSLNTQLSELRNKRLELITMEDEEGLKDIDQKIRDIENKLPQITEKSLKKDLFLSSSKKSKTPSLKEIAEKTSDQELEKLTKLLTEKKDTDTD